MTERTQFVGARLRSAALRTGLLTGAFLSVTFMSWLWVANQMPQFATYASLRNIVGGGLTVLWMAIPVLRFWRQPVTLFVSGLTGWILLTVTYMTMETRYTLLDDRMGALQVFMLGAICYAFVAVFQWVSQFCVEARHRHVAQVSHPEGSAPRRRAD